MWVEAISDQSLASRARDVFSLAKPRLSALVLCTAAGGMWLAPGELASARILWSLACISALVAAANACNCYLERDADARMHRTASRPLAAGRLEPRAVVWGASLLAAFSCAGLAWAANPLTAVLGVVAFLSYVNAYTPLKRYSALALFVGAIPGALPPLMGWTTVTGRLDPAGLVLFAILFAWQLPHFIAISLYLREDYARGGFRVFSIVVGERGAKLGLLASTVALLPTSLLLVPLGVAGPLYGSAALVLGLAFIGVAAGGLSRNASEQWARRAFVGSLVYLTLLFAALALDATRLA